MSSDLVAAAAPKLQKALEHLSDELKTIRTGRASTALVEDIKVSIYDQQMPIKQLASISTPDATTIAISAWDQNSTAAIAKAIREDKDLNMNPVSDGKVIHLNVPSLTQERREQFVKQIGEKVEQCFVAIRSVRHEVLDEAKQLSQSKELGEDDYHRIVKQIDAKIEELHKQIEELAETKRKEVREI